MSGAVGTVWSKDVTVKIQGGDNPPLAVKVFDEDVKIDGLVVSQYTLSATLLNRPNARADSVRFNITIQKSSEPQRVRIDCPWSWSNSTETDYRLRYSNTRIYGKTKIQA